MYQINTGTHSIEILTKNAEYIRIVPHLSPQFAVLPVEMVIFTAMKKILKLSNPNDYAEFVGAPVVHPLVSIVHYDELKIRSSLNDYGVYGLFIQREFPEDLSYGMRPYKAEKGSIIAVAPGQIGGREDDGSLLSFSGWALLWSPELLHNTDLGDRIKDFHYFSYFGDIVHKATGGTAIGYIHSFVVNQGKNLLMKGYSISETAYRLGFEYPHHFSRIFKNVSGMSPREFISSDS